MERSVFNIKKMDCHSEENLIRMKLQPIGQIRELLFDIEARILIVYHDGVLHLINDSLAELKLDSELISLGESDHKVKEETNQRKLLWAVLAINFGFFIIEMLTGVISKSMGLVADSLDMLADASVYGLSLFAVGGSLIRKKRIAKTAGYFQIVLALIGFIEVINRFLTTDANPEYSTMIIVSIFALIGNGFCLYLLQKSKSKEAHMQASMIFTSNDVVINLGVIAAGILVAVLDSNKPDLIIGTIVFVFVIQGAVRILKLGK